jgi:hypothetical protein
MTQPTQTQQTTNSTRSDDDASRKVFVGGVNGEGEQEIRLDRFESLPLGELPPSLSHSLTIDSERNCGP